MKLCDKCNGQLEKPRWTEKRKAVCAKCREKYLKEYRNKKK